MNPVPALQADLRFRAAPLELRGVYRMLLDFMDAAGDVAAHGLDGAGAAAAALGCTRDEAAPLLARMESAALLRVEPARVCLLVGSPRGTRGGMSPAERTRRSRAKPPAVTAGNGPVTGVVTGEVSGNTAESRAGHGSVTGAVASDVTGSAPPAAPPSSLSPAPPLPLTPSPPPAPAGGVGRGPGPLADVAARQPKLLDLGAPTVPAAAKRPEPRALPFTIGEALDALAASSAGRFVRGESRDIDKKTAVPLVAMVKAYPTLGEWSLVGEWLSAGAMPHCPTLGLTWACSSGLRSAMALARDWNAKGRPSPDAAARPATARAASGPLPAAPRSAFEHATLASRLGLRWRAPTDGRDRDAEWLAQTGLTVDEARRRAAALPAPTPAHAPAGATR